MMQFMSMLPTIMQTAGPILSNMRQPSNSSANRNQMLSLASQVLNKRPQSLPPRPPIPRPLPPRPTVQARASSMPVPIQAQGEDKTMLYLGIGAVALVTVVLLVKK